MIAGPAFKLTSDMYVSQPDQNALACSITSFNLWQRKKAFECTKMTVNNSDAMLPCMMMGNLSGTARLTQQFDIVSFPGLPCDQFLIIRSVQKLEVGVRPENEANSTCISNSNCACTCKRLVQNLTTCYNHIDCVSFA